MELGFDGKVALVTGAASGIGRATALAFACEGATMVLLDRDPEGLESAREEIAAAGSGAVDALEVDVGDRAQVDDAHDETVRRHGRIDIAFNNAGVTQLNTITHETPEDVYDRVMAVNLKGVWLGMRAQLRHMDGRGGAIVNTASITGVVGAKGMSPYTAAKHAVIGLTRTAALEYAQRGVRVNAVAPGLVETPMLREYSSISGTDVTDPIRAAHPVGRGAETEEVASAVLWLASEQASFVTGHVLVVDGGFTAQ